MISDNEGFSRPSIDESKCIHCSKCARICHANKPSASSRKEACVGWHKDDMIRKHSSSGGAFSGLAQVILKAEGVVFGSAFDAESQSVKVCMIQNEGDLDRLRRSKYVESKMQGAIDCVSEQLRKNIRVLFCGTPCMCAGLKACFPHSELLITVSFLCHGVASPRVFTAYLKEIGEGRRISDINMRPKDYGWHDHSIRMSFADGSKYSSHYSLDPYFYGDMVKSLFLRDSCYACQYTDGHMSDITIGDYWGVKANHEIEDTNEGISLLIANTSSGTEIIEESREYLHLVSVPDTSVEYAFYPSHLGAETQRKIAEKKAFVRRVGQDGFLQTAKRTYLSHTFKRRIKVCVKEIKWRVQVLRRRY